MSAIGGNQLCSLTNTHRCCWSTVKLSSNFILKILYSLSLIVFDTQPPPTTPASGQDFKDKNHRFAIQNGKTREQSQEYMVFKQHYCLSWGR